MGTEESGGNGEMANFHSYSTSTWAWIIIKDGEMIGGFYRTKAEADKANADIGGIVKRTRY
jgi:hypothetical protein